jgi:dUTP pyrophosphatase
MILIPTKVVSKDYLPVKAYDGSSAAYDLRAEIPEPFTLHPLDRAVISTGVRIHLPTGVVGLVCHRSGLALKHGITVLNAPGIIDPGYVDTIGVILINFNDTPYTISPQEKIGQLLIIQNSDIKLSTDLNFETNTVRGLNGYGSSGKI